MTATVLCSSRSDEGLECMRSARHKSPQTAVRPSSTSVPGQRRPIRPVTQPAARPPGRAVWS